MIYRELIRQVSKKSKIKQQDVVLVLESLRDVVVDSISSGDVVKFKNLGVFYKRLRKGREKINYFGSGKYISVPDRNIVKFRVSKSFKNFINN